MNKNLRIAILSTLFFLVFGFSRAQPVPVTVVPPNSTHFVKIADLVYFTAGDALWRTDGTASGTIMLKAGFADLGPFREHNGMLYFPVSRGPNYSSQWKALWRSDGTPSGTVLLKTSSAYDVSIVGEAGDLLYFTASDGTAGKELYRTNGTPSGTFLLKDINPGSASGFSGPASGVENSLLFAANDGLHGNELWSTDGTSGGTIMVKDINPGAADGFAPLPFYSQQPVYTYNGLFYFPGVTTQGGLEPWISDGTDAGTRMVRDLVPGAAGARLIQFAIASEGFLYFLTFNSNDDYYSGGADLWKTNGTADATVKLKTIGADGEQHEFHSFRIFKGKVYFSDYTEYFADNLWVSDGTPAGTNSFFNLITIEGSLFYFDVIGQYILFAGAPENIPTDLYRTDGTNAGTERFARFKSGSYGTYPRDLTKVNDLLFYADHESFVDYGTPYNEDDYYQLYQTDGDTIQSIRTLYGISTVGSDNITDFNGKVLFTTHNTQSGAIDTDKRLWIYDPSVPAPKTSSFTLVDATTDQDLRRLTEGASFDIPNPYKINIRYNPVETPGSVVFKLNGVPTRTETAAPYSLAGDVKGDYAPWQDAKPGTYELTATPYSGTGGTGTPGESLTLHFTIECGQDDEDCINSGYALRELWTGVQGNNVSDIPLERAPDSRRYIAKFEAPVNSGTNYGARVRGYVVPPASGNYTFWIASNDHSELWLSTDERQANKVRIAYVNGATDSRQWNKFPSQKSTPIALVAGRKYYIEALHKQGVGSDNLAVGWQLPDGNLERPMPGNRLSPYQPGDSQTPTVKITSPTEGQSFTSPADMNIEAEAYDGDDGTIVKVQFFKSSTPEEFTKIGEDVTAPYSFLWEDVPAGSYAIIARATDGEGNVVDSRPVNVSVEPGSGACAASGTITREYWTGVQGDRVSDIPRDTPPNGTGELTIFEGPTNWATNYGARIRGYLCPPASGNYVFWISSNDQSELWLSSDDDPAHKVRIAYLDRATGYRAWNTFTTQKSAAIPLVQGKRYYIEALHKQGVGTDHVSVGWQLPGGTMERPIPGSRLSPFETDMAAMAFTSEQNSLYEQIDVYPNPAQSDDPQLVLSGYQGIEQTIETEVQIINMTGDVVFRDRIQCGGDCSSYLMKMNGHLRPGLYLVNLKTNGVRHSKRLLVK